MTGCSPELDAPSGGVAASVLADVLNRLLARPRFTLRPGLERIERVLAALGRPERAFRAVHVAGTNGKGSTCAILAAALQAAGYRTGLFTSPHLHRFSERIKVDGEEIAATDLARIIERALALDPELTFFEACTAAAFAYFAEARVDIAVVETGLGGRLDATNVIRPLVSVVTAIGRDHMSVLGEDIEQIAREKAGIIKLKTPVVVATQLDAVTRVLCERCAEVGAPAYLAGRDFTWEVLEDGRVAIRGVDSRVSRLRPGLLGVHQGENAAVAYVVLELLERLGLPTSAEARRRGIERVRWPGRMEWIGRFLLDCAHNELAARVLASQIEPRAGWLMIYGSLADKDVEGILPVLLPRVAQVIFTTPPGARALPAERLRALEPAAQVAESVGQALAWANSQTCPVLVTGSIYLVAEARRILLREPVDPIQVADPSSPGAGEATREGERAEADLTKGLG